MGEYTDVRLLQRALKAQGLALLLEADETSTGLAHFMLLDLDGNTLSNAGQDMKPMKICIVGASGKLGILMVQHALDRGCQVNAVCRERSLPKLDLFKDRIALFPGPTNDRTVIEQAVRGCEGVLAVLVPWGRGYSTGTAQAVLDFAPPDARLIFSCGWHISRDGQDLYPPFQLREEKLARLFGKITRIIDLDDQVEACRRIFLSDRRWTVVRGSDLEEGPSKGLPVWSRHVGDPILLSNLTRRVDFALFMVAALWDDTLIREAPAIVSCRSPSALKAAAVMPDSLDLPEPHP